MSELFHDTHFWVLISTVVFAVVAYKKGKAPILSMLDGRTARIQSDLEEAARLRREALALPQREQVLVELEAGDLVERGEGFVEQQGAGSGD